MPEATIWVIFTTSFIVGLSGAMMPGPLLAVTIGETVRRGFWAGPKLVLGHGILELSLVVVLAAGLSEFIKNNAVTIVVGLIGGVILIWMGIGALRQSRAGGIVPSATGGVQRSGQAVFSGILVSLSNPYWLIWWATLGTAYLLWALKLGISGVATFFSGHILSDLAWYSVVSFVIASGRKVIKDNVYRVLLALCGVALIVLGGYFIISAIRLVTGNG